MQILNELNLTLGRFLREFAIDHCMRTGKCIDCFILPEAMYVQLSEDPDFEQSGLAWMGEFDGFFIFGSSKNKKACMREVGAAVNHPIL